jgi:uncharacterized membrane protein
MSTPDFLLLLAVMALVSFVCRAAGFMAMRFIPMTPRFEAALRATPVSVMAGIVAIAAMRGGLVEWLAIALVIGLMKLTGRDIVSAFAGIGAVALMRAAGM